MKNLIVILFSMMLGIHVFIMLVEDDNSVRGYGAKIMQQQVEQLQTTP